jgi:hypothetical protein
MSGMPIHARMRRYRVTAFYEHPELERNAVIEAESTERAMIRALIERRIPAGFTRDEFGWIEPVFWKPEMAGRMRWPRLLAPDRLGWGDGEDLRWLRFSVEEDS